MDRRTKSSHCREYLHGCLYGGYHRYGRKVGDEVEIFGKHISVTESSDKLGNDPPYEILTSVLSA